MINFEEELKKFHESMEIEDGLQLGAAACVLLRIGQSGALRSILSGIAVAVGLLVLVLLFEKLLKREAMGGADIKLVAVLGLHFGLLQTLYLLIIACIVLSDILFFRPSGLMLSAFSMIFSTLP